jgi:hypothetical protein
MPPRLGICIPLPIGYSMSGKLAIGPGREFLKARKHLLHKPDGGGSHCCGKGCLNRLWAGVTLLAMVFAEGCSTPSMSNITTAGPEVIQLDRLEG